MLDQANEQTSMEQLNALQAQLMQLQSRQTTTDALFRLGQALMAPDPLPDVMADVTTLLAEVLQAEITVVAVVNQKQAALRLFQCSESSVHAPDFATYWHGLDGWVMREKNPLRVTSLERSSHESEAAYQRRVEIGLPAGIILPLMADDAVLGTLAAGFQDVERVQAYDVMTIMSTAVDQIGPVIQQRLSMEATQRRAVQMTAIADIARATSQVLDLETLLPQAVNLIKDRFGLYYAGIFLLDEIGEWAILHAGTGDAGRTMLERNHRLRVAGGSMVGQSALKNQALISEDVTQADHWMANPLLPETHSEMALPLISRGQTMGVMTIQSQEFSAFSQDDIASLQVMADQLANAISNLQLFAQSQERNTELQRIQQQYSLDQWDTYRQRTDVMGYSYDLDSLTPLGTSDIVDRAAWTSSPVLRSGDEGAGAAMLEPLSIRDQQVGLLSFEEPETEFEWSDDQAEVMAAVKEQLELALENRLLIDQSQRALREARQRESELGFLQEISTVLNATNDLNTSYDALYEHLRTFAPLEQFVLYAYNAETDILRPFVGTQTTPVDVNAGFLLEPDAESAMRWVISQNMHIIEDDLKRRGRFIEDNQLAQAGIRSRALIPLQLGVRTLGIFEIGARERGVYSQPGVLPVLQQIAAQMASAIERGNLLSVAQISAEESRALYEATSDLAEANDASAVLDVIREHAYPDAPGAIEIMLFVEDPQTGAQHEWMELAAAAANIELDQPQTIGLRVPVSDLFPLALLRLQPFIASSDITQDTNIPEPMREALLAQGLKAFVLASLTTGVGDAEQLGFMALRLMEPYSFSEQELRVLSTVADQASVVLSNRKLFQQAEERVERQSTAVALANLTTAISDRQTLLDESVRFLQERFDLYFSGIYMQDSQAQWADLQSGTGDAGKRLMAMGHRVPVRGTTMVSRCMASGERMMDLDMHPDAALMENPLLPETRSVLIFPLISRGQVTGSLSLLSKQRFAFTQDDIDTLDLMINQLANVIESTNLYERSQSSLAETRMLYRIAQQITDARDVQDVLQAAVDGLAQREEPDWITATLLAPQPNPTDMQVVISWSRDGQELPFTSLPLTSIQRFSGILDDDERFVTPDVTQDPMVDDALRRIYNDLNLRATAAFQIKVRGMQYGTILVQSHNAREFTTAELNFYENVARQAFVALENLSLVETTSAQAERRDILNQVLQTASSSLDQMTILRDVGRVMSRRLTMPTMMWQWDGVSAQVISVHDAQGTPLIDEEQIPRLSANEMLQIYNVIEQRTSMHISFKGEESALLNGIKLAIDPPLEEGYAVPLVARDQVYGVLLLGRQQGQEPLREEDRAFVDTAGVNVSTALETAYLYQEAQDTAEKLKEVDQLKNQFMANMSHELRTPLNSIIGFSRVMIKGIDGPLTEMQETDLNAIYESGRHLLGLINDILDISKIAAGKMEIAFEQVDIGSMITSVMSTGIGFTKDKPIKLETDVPEGLPIVVADGRRIRQVLINLLGNAGKFTEEGSIRVSATFDDYQVIVNVQDSGIGIPSDRLHAVFEQFEQVDSSSSRSYGGTGLGLPLSREFVRLHGGDMWIQETQVGVGSTFSFSLPIGGPDSVREDDEEIADAPTTRVVLAVDDDENVVTLFRRYLERQGYRVFGLTGSDRVLAEAKRLKPFAITLDVLMPGKDGWEVIRELKADPETAHIPIIVCSILSETERGLSLGVADYLMKPVNAGTLVDALARVEQPGKGGYVLVTDDNPDDRKLLSRILTNEGYRVVQVEGGKQAIEQIQNDPPRLLVLDLMMPEVDGFEVIESLKRNRATQQIPVVVVTAKELTDDERIRLQQGVTALLQKGLFDQQQLLQDISMALSRLHNRDVASTAVE